MEIKDRVINVIVELIGFFSMLGLSILGISYLVVTIKLGGTVGKVIMGTLSVLTIITIVIEEITKHKKCKAIEELMQKQKEEQEAREKIREKELQEKRKHINRILDTEISKLSKSEIDYIKNMNKED